MSKNVDLGYFLRIPHGGCLLSHCGSHRRPTVVEFLRESQATETNDGSAFDPVMLSVV